MGGVVFIPCCRFVSFLFSVNWSGVESIPQPHLRGPGWQFPGAVIWHQMQSLVGPRPPWAPSLCYSRPRVAGSPRLPWSHLGLGWWGHSPAAAPFKLTAAFGDLTGKLGSSLRWGSALKEPPASFVESMTTSTPPIWPPHALVGCLGPSWSLFPGPHWGSWGDWKGPLCPGFWGSPPPPQPF